MVFGINSASNAVRKCEIVRGEAEYYFTLPDCIASAINEIYYKLILHLRTISLIGTVLAEHSMLLLLKNLTVEGQKNSVATAASVKLLYCHLTNGSYRWQRYRYLSSFEGS